MAKKQIKKKKVSRERVIYVGVAVKAGNLFLYKSPRPSKKLMIPLGKL